MIGFDSDLTRWIVSAPRAFKVRRYFPKNRLSKNGQVSKRIGVQTWNFTWMDLEELLYFVFSSWVYQISGFNVRDVYGGESPNDCRSKGHLEITWRLFMKKIRQLMCSRKNSEICWTLEIMGSNVMFAKKINRRNKYWEPS